ncbi:MAG: hypothetical protein IJP64_06295 [Oscillospiraceae bacterium]|nr:hypothetical protein [Oscillospiraceae bacterium]
MAKTKPVSIEKREVFIPRGGSNEESTLFAAVNGVSYLLPKGKKSLVPDFVADEIERSQAAEEAMYEARARLQEQSK